MKIKLVGLSAAFLIVGFLSNVARAWDEEGHIIVTRLAHQKLPDRLPEWVRSGQVIDRLAYLSGEPDRWRGQKNVDLDHTNNPDHYFDAEDITDFGLTLKTLPPLKREFTDLLAATRAQHPDRFKPYERKDDRDYTRLVPGLLPYHIAELQWKLASSWTTLKTYETNRSLCSDSMIENARQNIIYEMGILSHFIGDGAQPLHLTRHHHGWVGDNPKSYTTDKKFHSEIDGGVIALHHIDAASLASRAKTARTLSRDHYFADICDYLGETFAQVEPLYELEHSGELHKAAGKKFIEDRLIEGGSMLAGVWATAYDSAVIDEFRVKQLQRNGKKHEALGDSR